MDRTVLFPQKVEGNSLAPELPTDPGPLGTGALGGRFWNALAVEEPLQRSIVEILGQRPLEIGLLGPR